MADWSMHRDYVYDEIGSPTPRPTGSKFEFVHVPEFGTRGVRWTSMSINPFTEHSNGDGSTIMNWRKYFNSATKQELSGSAVGNVPLNDLYMRYCIMVEKDVWTDMNEIGVKLGGLDKEPSKAGGVFWHSKPDAQGQLRLTTYWYGEGYTSPGGWGGDWIQGVYLQPDTWHCLEEHLKLNSMNPDGTPNADAVREAWLDDKLIYSRKDFVIHRYTGQPLEIRMFWGQIFHGGANTPLTPIHYRVTGFALAKRRIGVPQRIQ
jgi:hypothetical protein